MHVTSGESSASYLALLPKEYPSPHTGVFLYKIKGKAGHVSLWYLLVSIAKRFAREHTISAHPSRDRAHEHDAFGQGEKDRALAQKPDILSCQ